MTLRPSTRLIVVAAIAIVPLATVAGFLPPLAPAGFAALALIALIAAVDAFTLTRSIARWSAAAPASLQWFQDREAALPIVLQHSAAASHNLRLHVNLPPEIEPRDKSVAFRIEGSGIAEFACVPRRRGEFHPDTCDIEQPSALGLWYAGRTLPIHSEVRVYPDLRRERAADLIRSHARSGAHARRQLGKGREFEKLRDYEHGDSFEDIYWKATARRQKPVVKVFQIERTQEVYAIIDSSRLSARGDILDSYVTAALALAITAEAQHDRFGLASFSAGIDNFIPAASGKRHFAFCRDAIYAVQPRPVTPDIEEVFSYLHTHLHKRSLIIFLTALDDPFLADAFVNNVRVLSRRHLVLVNVPEQADVRPLFTGAMPASADEVYTRLAGHMHWTRLRELQKTLERRGVRLAVVDPAQLPSQLARQYIEVKQRQLL